MSTALDVRASMVSALAADLVGPFDPSVTHEVLPVAPSRWYLTGFLAPQADRDTRDPTADDEFKGADDEDDEEGGTAQEPEPKQKYPFPASMGLSALLPPASACPDDRLAVTVTFATYARTDLEVEGTRKKKVVWRRVPHSPSRVDLPLSGAGASFASFLPDKPGVEIALRIERAEAPGLAVGTRALSVFVVNRLPPAEEKGRGDESYLFQVEMTVEHPAGFVPRPNLQGEGATDFDDRTADLQFRDHAEWAVGHNVSVARPASERPVTSLRTTWIPTSEVHRVVTHDDPAVVTAMEDLAALPDAASVQAALAPLVASYEHWIAAQAARALPSECRAQTRARLVKNARRAKDRIASGIARLAADPLAFEAFRLMNRAMAMAARARSPDRYPEGAKPSWRLFQLAFVLLSLDGIVDPHHPDREEVELIFFPTGGGKTEAYLGVIGFTLVLRRLRGLGRPDAGLGVAVLLRYTLRLLTLDQLGRAATLCCALELLRREDPKRLGEVRFAVGLWVGRSATANTLDQVKRLINEYKVSPAKNPPSPFPLEKCPWCGGELGRDSLALRPSASSPEEVLAHCVSPSGSPPSTCAFSPRNDPDGLPVVFVDEQLYRELPCFVVATVDKFAMLPWRGETAMLFGQVTAREGRRFYGVLDKEPRGAVKVPGGLGPPELIVQDELHLISGPLGTMVGLYETAIEHLSSRVIDGNPLRPKVIASTATVRRAREQIRALFGRGSTTLFPPPGPDAGETFFATLDRASAGRLYVGVAAPGRSLKAILLRTYVALMGAAQRRYDRHQPETQPADAYMTLAGYFNSLRELGGMRRLVEDDVRTRLGALEKRAPDGMIGAHPWGRNRDVSMPVELTSREKGGAIKAAKDRLARPHARDGHVDVLLASNMISVGVDIDRLGLMVIAGQPKTASEYIQASSRVGRQHPGLVVTCFNVRKPRDRSHFERFEAWHQSFYRYVEATSLTPFCGPALDRGLAGTLIAMTRLGAAVMTPPAGAMAIDAHRALAEACVKELADRGARHTTSLEAEEITRLESSLRQRGLKLIDAWEKLVKTARDEGATKRAYSPFDRDKTAGKPLLYTVIDEQQPERGSLDAHFAAPTSMRDVEPTVHLWIERRALGGRR